MVVVVHGASESIVVAVAIVFCSVISQFHVVRIHCICDWYKSRMNTSRG